ncbi:MAG: hypothetical protein AB1750_02170 [Chloroflexota bacterium]
MEIKPRNNGALVGGTLLIAFGILALFSEIFEGFAFWPFIIVGVGALFFVGMAAGGKSAAPLAIPGSIISVIGLMLFVQNVTDHWESWAYSWTVILMAVGLGIFIMGWWAESPGQRASGLGVLRVGAILFIVFGAFFEGLIFQSFGFADFVFPVALILLGLYLIFRRSGLLGGRKDDNQSDNTSTM